MQMNIFILICTLLIVKPTANGLFVGEVGVDQLPLAFILVAIFAGGFSILYSKILKKRPLNVIVLTTLVASIAVFVLFGLLFFFGVSGDWIFFSLYIWVTIFGVLTASQFWIIANVVFNAREAKRLFGFIGAGAIAGGIFGGYLTSILVESLGSENMLFVGAGLLSLCIPLTMHNWRQVSGQPKLDFLQKKKMPVSDHPIALIRKSRHLTYLAAIIGIGSITAKLVDYQFNIIAVSRISDPDELTAFFGFWFSNINILSLAIQLLLTRRIVGTLGIGTSLFFLPLSILAGAICVFFAPELWAGILIKLSDGSLKQSVNKAAVELLSLPIPQEIKNSTKTFIDVVVDSIATGIGGIILIFLVNGFELSTRWISLMIFALVIGWIFLVRKIRITYLHSFKSAMKKHETTPDDISFLPNQTVMGDLQEMLAKGSEPQILFVLKKLIQMPDPRLATAIGALLDRGSAKVQEQAIRALYFIKYPVFTQQIKPFTSSENHELKVAAFDYLIEHQPSRRFAILERQEQESDLDIRLAVLASLAEESRGNPELMDEFQLRDRLDDMLLELDQIEDQDEKRPFLVPFIRVLGVAALEEYVDRIKAWSTDPNIEVAIAALEAAGDTMNPAFIQVLIENLKRKELSSKVQNVLIRFGPGILGPLQVYAASESANSDILAKIPGVVEYFGTQASVDLLLDLCQRPELPIKMEALRSLNLMKTRHDYLKYSKRELSELIHHEAKIFQQTLSFLYVQSTRQRNTDLSGSALDIQALREKLMIVLESRLDRSLERIFRLLGLKYPIEEVNSIYSSIQSPVQEQRINALEYLDNLLEPSLKKILIPLVETTLFDPMSVELVRQLNLHIPSEEECYRQLLEGNDAEVRGIILSLKEQLKKPK